MCGRSYKAPKATPTPPAPNAPNAGASKLVFDNGSGRSIEDQLKELSRINPLKVTMTGATPTGRANDAAVDLARRQAEVDAMGRTAAQHWGGR